MTPRLAQLLLTAGLALHVHTILRARRILTDALNLDGDPDGACGASWCPCQVALEDEPRTHNLRRTDDQPAISGDSIHAAVTGAICVSAIPYGGGHTCTLPAGHGGLHAAGGWRWTDSFGTDAA